MPVELLRILIAAAVILLIYLWATDRFGKRK